MPVKRRVDKRRELYPDALVRLIDDLPIEYSDQAEAAIFDLYFFHRYPELTDPPLHDRAGKLIDTWTAVAVEAARRRREGR